MSQDDFYRGDPPGYAAPPHGAPTHGPPGYEPPSYGPPAYGPPGYGPPPMGPPGYGPSSYGPAGYWPGWRRPTNQLAIVALVAAFVFAPVGLVLGLLARGQIRRSGEQGDGLALAAAIVGGLGTTLMATGLLAWIGLLASISDGAFAP
ncbi:MULTISPECIES: DUF4190 domain-containing protein [unclassified Modestobacter]|uniref:DUF4190 domain-containing protein n=1 Tax=unclassified Modestobacter TaxID=2643866 RepID=UPI0022AB3D90|nr:MULTISPECIES: DUF4190 domain-containing protein [unclassified Modestobacter]MCZ2824175.1 DUF4190 domain-containing protein [Modestobacter sp. VKM Ac-2981]MCZ2854297.1 DUF4190 domain-containing protein [Modestobacter sp. VKM Ac-2982]